MDFKASGLGVVVWLIGCGGTIELQEGRGGAGGSMGNGAVSGVGGDAGSTDAGVAGQPDAGDTFPPVEHLTQGALAYDRDTDGSGRAIYLQSFADSGCTKRLTDPSAQAKQAAFSADGAAMAYAALEAGVYQIHLMTLASGDIEVLTGARTGATSPAFSPDGWRLSYVTGDPEQAGNREPGAGDLVLVHLDTGDERTLIDADSLGCCTAQALSPAFVSDSEIVVATGSAMLAVNVDTLAVRDLVPFNGRIPNPRDPAPGPDGIRYAFTDYCAGQALFIGRLDGSTGDTCASAKLLPTGAAFSADWGQHGYIAAESASGLVLVDDGKLEAFSLPGSSGARNPAWFPTAPQPSCE